MATLCNALTNAEVCVCMQDSKFFQMFDVDGDGLISYSEYLLLITFLSIPVEVSLALVIMIITYT